MNMSGANPSEASKESGSQEVASGESLKLTPEQKKRVLKAVATYLKENEAYKPKLFPQSRADQILSRLD
jgi:hypothetical protein